MDISNRDRTASEIFKVIISKGPVTLYTANALSNMPIGTIHRHFKEMLESQKIKVYETAKSGRKKISYGPTLYGFIYFYRIDHELKKNLEHYFDRWIEKGQFFLELKEAGFDEKKTLSNQAESKKIFEKFVYFYSGVEDQLAYLVNNLNEVPRDVKWFLGGFLLVRRQEYMKAYEDLLRLMPSLRRDVNDIMQSTMRANSGRRK